MTPTPINSVLFDALNETTPTRPSETTITRLLNDRQQRAILRYLQTHTSPVDIKAMIGQLVRQEHDSDTHDLTAELMTQISTAVWTVHLPLLADHDIIRYDQESGKLRWWHNAGCITRQLEELSNQTTDEK